MGSTLLRVAKQLASVEFGGFCETFGRPSEGIQFDPADPDVDMRAAPHESTGDIVTFYGRARAAADTVIEEVQLEDDRMAWYG